MNRSQRLTLQAGVEKESICYPLGRGFESLFGSHLSARRNPGHNSARFGQYARCGGRGQRIYVPHTRHRALARSLSGESTCVSSSMPHCTRRRVRQQGRRHSAAYHLSVRRRQRPHNSLGRHFRPKGLSTQCIRTRCLHTTCFANDCSPHALVRTTPPEELESSLRPVRSKSRRGDVQSNNRGRP